MDVNTHTAKRWHQRWLVRIPLALIVLIVALGIIAVATAPEPAAPPLPEPTTAAPAVAPADPDAYLREVAAIDPGLTVNRDRALNRADNICSDLAAGKDEATVIRNARERLSGGSASVDDDQAAAVVEQARTHICR